MARKLRSRDVTWNVINDDADVWQQKALRDLESQMSSIDSAPDPGWWTPLPDDERVHD